MKLLAPVLMGMNANSYTEVLEIQKDDTILDTIKLEPVCMKLMLEDIVQKMDHTVHLPMGLMIYDLLFMMCVSYKQILESVIMNQQLELHLVVLTKIMCCSMIPTGMIQTLYWHVTKRNHVNDPLVYVGKDMLVPSFIIQEIGVEVLGNTNIGQHLARK